MQFQSNTLIFPGQTVFVWRKNSFLVPGDIRAGLHDAGLFEVGADQGGN